MILDAISPLNVKLNISEPMSVCSHVEIMLFEARPLSLVVLLGQCPAHQALFSCSFSLHLDFGIGNPSLQTID